ncbi:MAG: hypothetical protein IPJ34_30660 [Myxococcales bacterium]|nr:hypothetical protein [Myxococcales bacterium]
MRRAMLVGVLLTGAMACRRKPPATGDAGTVASASSAATSPAASAPRADPRWPEARTGDGLDLARLADLEGVDRLGEVAADPAAAPEDRRAAILALAYVPDPTPALSTLTALVLGTHLERSVLALDTLATLAGQRTQLEELEPGAWRACATALVGALSGMPKPRRDVAVRALLGMADRGAIARKDVPP